MAEKKSKQRHDEYDDKSYKKRCHCQKCVRTYDEWCRKKKEEGRATCKRKCYTICEIVCEQPVTTYNHWGYKKEYEGKWEHHRPEKRPDCKDRDCDKKQSDKHEKRSDKSDKHEKHDD